MNSASSLTDGGGFDGVPPSLSVQQMTGVVNSAIASASQHRVHEVSTTGQTTAAGGSAVEQDYDSMSATVHGASALTAAPHGQVTGHGNVAFVTATSTTTVNDSLGSLSASSGDGNHPSSAGGGILGGNHGLSDPYSTIHLNERATKQPRLANEPANEPPPNNIALKASPMYGGTASPSWSPLIHICEETEECDNDNDVMGSSSTTTTITTTTTRDRSPGRGFVSQTSHPFDAGVLVSDDDHPMAEAAILSR